MHKRPLFLVGLAVLAGVVAAMLSFSEKYIAPALKAPIDKLDNSSTEKPIGQSYKTHATQSTFNKAQAAAPQSNTGLESESLSKEINDLASQKWDKQSFDRALALLSDKRQPIQFRELLLQRAYSEKRRLFPDERRLLLTELTRIAKATDEPITLSSRAIVYMASLSLLMKDAGDISGAEAVAEKRFFMDVAKDKERDLNSRASALKAIDILEIADAVPLLKSLLADPKNLNQYEIARGSCLALAHMSETDAVEDIGRVLSTTENPSVFETAAYSLGQIKSIDSVALLMEQRDRFPETGALDFALVDMEDQILSILEKPESPNLVHAVQATAYLWKEGQKIPYISALYDLLSKAPLDARKEIAERLIHEAGLLPFEAEKIELRKIMAEIEYQSELESEREHIRKRLSAKHIESITSDVKVSTE
jgi:hypothetical protein